MSRYHDYLATAQSEKIKQYNDQVGQITALNLQLQQNLLELETRKQALQEQYRQLMAERKLRQKTLVAMRNQIQSKDSRLKQQQRERAELERVLSTLWQISVKRRPVTGKATFSQSGRFAQLKGHLPWPVQGRLMNRFGSPSNGVAAWDGLNISASAGTPVQVIHSGRVIFADWLRGQGLLIIVDHGDGYISLYAHNEVLFKEAGEWVQSGDTIAQIGDSGGQQDAGLYFEIRYQGVPQDPALWCKRG